MRLVFTLAVLSIALAATGLAQAPIPAVSTLAGSGSAGLADGPAKRATFLFPYGIAVARDGSVYISDRAAQRIRLLTPAGQVQTVAGSGAISPPGLVVAPGYVDGPALQARFAGPEGLAIGPDGGLYIADSYNHCIRELRQNQVTTVFGKCGSAGDADGTVSVGRFTHPRGLAFDAAGNLYVADDGVGLRRLDPNGLLTTIAFSSYHGKSCVGVAVVDESPPAIAISTLDGIVLYHPSSAKDERFSGYTLDLPSAAPNQIVAIDARQFLFTDALTHNVRLFQVPSQPNQVLHAVVFAGGAAERSTENAGYVDGSRFAARFYDPMGIALAGNRLVIADGGNRRIRQIVLPSAGELESM